MTNSDSANNLDAELDSIQGEGRAFFESLGDLAYEESPRTVIDGRVQPVWDQLTDAQKQASASVRRKVTDFSARLLTAANSAPLMDTADVEEIRRQSRELYAALELKIFMYTPPFTVPDERGAPITTRPRHLESPSSPKNSSATFANCCIRIRKKMQLLTPSQGNLSQTMMTAQASGIQKYRQNTAFIMMQIDERQPRLEDIKNCIKQVFREFGIEALRSDEIEHSDVITQRILAEITTSEFLIADLTGERPSVYYEVGYAHALGKRPILFREDGTRLHFDLSVHNVPSYKNVTDLRAKLTARLSAMLGRSPQRGDN